MPAIRKILDTVKPRYMFCGHGHFYRKAESDGCKIYSLDLVSKEYYILDTETDELTVKKTDSAQLPILAVTSQ